MNEGANTKSYEYFVGIDDIRPIESLTISCPQRDDDEFDPKEFESNLIDMEKAYYGSVIIKRRESGGAVITFLSTDFDLKKLAKLIMEQEYGHRFINSDILKECYSCCDEPCPEDPDAERVGDDYICLIDFPRHWRNWEYPYNSELVCKISAEYHHHAISMLNHIQTGEEKEDYSIPGISSYVYSYDNRTSLVYLLSEDFIQLDTMLDAIKKDFNRLTPKLLRQFLKPEKRLDCKEKKPSFDKNPFGNGSGYPFSGTNERIPTDEDGTGKFWTNDPKDPSKITVTY